MKDWKGNQIKAGDEISVVRYKTGEYLTIVGMFTPPDKFVPAKKEEVKYCWEVGAYKKVIEKYGVLFVRDEWYQDAFSEYEKEYQRTDTTLISMESSLNFMMVGSKHLIAIKGVSDNPTKAEFLSLAFSDVLKKWLGKDFEKMVDQNEKDSDCCSSHDFCDANMAMDEAFSKFIGREIDIQNSDDVSLWNEAWTLARKMNFYKDIFYNNH